MFCTMEYIGENNIKAFLFPHGSLDFIVNYRGTILIIQMFFHVFLSLSPCMHISISKIWVHRTNLARGQLDPYSLIFFHTLQDCNFSSIQTFVHSLQYIVSIYSHREPTLEKKNFLRILELLFSLVLVLLLCHIILSATLYTS